MSWFESRSGNGSGQVVFIAILSTFFGEKEAGELSKAILQYQKAIDLDPANINAVQMIKEKRAKMMQNM